GLGVVACFVALLMPAAGTSAGGPGGRIVFASDRSPDLNRTSFAAVSPRTGRTSEVGVAPVGAAIAPDRVHYAFARHRTSSFASSWDLVVGSFTGEAETLVATLPYEIGDPVWSPTGGRIVYTGW